MSCGQGNVRLYQYAVVGYPAESVAGKRLPRIVMPLSSMLAESQRDVVTYVIRSLSDSDFFGLDHVGVKVYEFGSDYEFDVSPPKRPGPDEDSQR